MKLNYRLVQLRRVYALAYCTPVARAFDLNDPLLGMFDSRHDVWLLNKIFVKRDCRGRHYGSILINRVCRQADIEGVTLLLTVDPDYDSPLQHDELAQFYSRHGFVGDPTIEGMIRYAH